MSHVKTLTKLDLRKELKPFYNPSTREPQLIKIPDMKFLIIDGVGDPSTSKDYQDSISAIFTLAYTMKFMVKKEESIDYSVMTLEGLWWNNESGTIDLGKRENWHWKSMMMQPDLITEARLQKATAEIRKKGKGTPALSKVRLEKFHEGLVAQIVHIGPYSAEKPTIEKLHQFIAEKGYRPRGYHHEVYLGDPRRAKPENLKTILRQPVTKN